MPLSTSDTVLTDTPAAWATSLMVIFFAIAITAGWLPLAVDKTFYQDTLFINVIIAGICDFYRTKIR
ncbi:hypothetical protein KOXM_08167 [Klebsiella michiganensis]|nr:hypothetical protein KOXM_08167 [Klebsiella michiganensis]